LKTNIIKFVDPRGFREEMREQACVWLARLDQGASKEDLDQLAAWLAEDPRRVRMLLNMAAMWDQSSVHLSELSEIFPLEEKTLMLQSRARRRFMHAVAASAFAAVFGGMAFWGAKTLAPWTHTYETDVGGRGQVTLPDGSEIVLNTDTRIQVEINRHERRIVLERGEGFFSVAKDKNRPFRVYAGSRVVEAVGTAFTVQHTEQRELEVMVAEGKVNFMELADEGAESESTTGTASERNDFVIKASMPVIAGERVTVNQNVPEAEKVQLQPDELELRTAWRVGMLVFQGSSLEEVLREVSRYTRVRLKADDNIKNIAVEGYFRAGDIDGLLVSMERNFKIVSEWVSEDQVVLMASNKEE
jgi:transmembrane sensor